VRGHLHIDPGQPVRRRDEGLADFQVAHDVRRRNGVGPGVDFEGVVGFDKNKPAVKKQKAHDRRGRPS